MRQRLYPVTDTGPDLAGRMAAQVARAQGMAAAGRPGRVRLLPRVDRHRVGALHRSRSGGGHGVAVGRGRCPHRSGRAPTDRDGAAPAGGVADVDRRDRVRPEGHRVGEPAKLLLTHSRSGLWETNVHSGLSSGEGLAAVFAVDPDTNGDQAGGRKAKARLLPDGDCRLLAYEPEWASVMARMKREGNTLSATLRAAWEGGNLSTLNVDARVARRGSVGILAHITPGEFKAKVSSSDLAGGTYNQFLPIGVGQTKFLAAPAPPRTCSIGAPWRGPGPPAATGRAARRARVPDPTPVTCGPRSTSSSAPCPNTTNGSPSFTSRAAPHWFRVAALYAALDGTAHINARHLTAAAALIRYSLASAHRRAPTRP